MNYTNGSA